MNWEYDDLDNGNYRIRVFIGDAKHEADFSLPNARWPQLKARLAEELEKLAPSIGEHPSDKPKTKRARQSPRRGR